uniref:Uncharacterized protein n=1 Tax=Anguilla anguilla TaxID=7936 RepID=A0A0E9SKI5_ANGAN
MIFLNFLNFVFGGVIYPLKPHCVIL